MTATATRNAEQLPKEEVKGEDKFFLYAYGTDGKVKDVLPTTDHAEAVDLAVRASKSKSLREVVILTAGSTRREVFTAKSETSYVKYSRKAFEAAQADAFLEAKGSKKKGVTHRSPGAKRERVQFDPTPILVELVKGIGEAVSASKTSYARITSHGKTLAYANFKAGWIQLDFAAAAVKATGLPHDDLQETKGGARMVLRVETTEHVTHAQTLLRGVAALKQDKAKKIKE